MKKLSIAILSLVLIGCSSNELNREKAKEMIEIEFGFPYVETVKLKSATRQKDINGRLKELLNDGYISINYLRSNSFGGSDRIKLTDKGKIYFLEKKNGQFIMASNEMRIKEVSGIKFNENKTSAKVEYIAERYNVTPFGRDKYYNYNNGDTKKGNLTFEKYDDGWRVLNGNNFKGLQKTKFPAWN